MANKCRATKDTVCIEEGEFVLWLFFQFCKRKIIKILGFWWSAELQKAFLHKINRD